MKIKYKQMKNKTVELDVDFIGGEKPLTKEEELTISEFIRKSKENRLKDKAVLKSKLKRKKRSEKTIAPMGI